jgi:hypothetical protein
VHEDNRVALAFIEKGDLDIVVCECRHENSGKVKDGDTYAFFSGVETGPPGKHYRKSFNPDFPG